MQELKNSTQEEPAPGQFRHEALQGAEQNQEKAAIPELADSQSYIMIKMTFCNEKLNYPGIGNNIMS
ncbi:MAG: hypothetical protein PHW04_14160 [Candidatus Wallbacteria bacterium]|nr:hypothetical protein [Candidatus Wallbacteria bacterium]